MTDDLQACMVCGTPRAEWINDNCPFCLMQLGTPWPDEGGPVGPLGQTGSPNESKTLFGDYELISEIARGGMGVVYRARQLSLKREVALKVLLSAQFSNPAAVKRFQREAETAAGLNHPNIVRIYEIGEDQGHPYFSMELIEGQNLADLTREKPLPAREAAQLVKAIAEAMQFAHDKGLLHRDLKPSNVIVDGWGVPHITDFGLAKVAHPDEELTITGQVLGTPSYMSPEQADPRRGEMTVRSDVYSLGAMLYHLVTARPPFVAESITQALRLVEEAEPVAPTLLSPGIPRDLETIIMKCLEKDPSRRYGSARALAEELNRFHNHEPIQARRIGPAARLVRWHHRNPRLALSLSAAALLLLAVVIGSPVALFQINSARNLTMAANKETRQQLFHALLEQAHSTVRGGDIGQRVNSLEAIRRAAAIAKTPELRREAFAALALPDLRFERELATDGPDYVLVRLDHQFQRIAWGRPGEAIRIRSASNGTLLASLPPGWPGSLLDAEWSPDDRLLALNVEPDSAVSGCIEVWDVAASRLLMRTGNGYKSMQFHPRLRVLVAGTIQNTVRFLDLQTGNIVKEIATPDVPNYLRFSPDGNQFAVACSGSNRWSVSTYDANGTPLTSAPFSNRVSCLDWAGDGRWLGMTLIPSGVGMLELRSGNFVPLGQHKAVAATAYSIPGSQYFLSGGYEKEIRCWNMITRRLELTMTLDTFKVQMNFDGSQCAFNFPKKCDIYAFEHPTTVRELAGESDGNPHSGAFSPDGRWLAVADLQKVMVWDLIEPGPAASVSVISSWPLRFSNSRQLLVSTGVGCSVWNISPGASQAAPVLTQVAFPEQDVTASLCALSNGIVMSGAQGSRWISFDHQSSNKWEHTAGGMNCISPDGSWLATCQPRSAFVNIYRLPSFEFVTCLTNSAGIFRLTASPSGDEMAVACDDRVAFWDTASWTLKTMLTNFTRAIYAPSEPAWWLTSGARSAGLYDSKTAKVLLPLPSGSLPLAVSQDGRFLAVSVEARRIQVRDLVQVRSEFRSLGIDW